MTDGSTRLVFVAANPSIDRLHEVDAIEAGAIHRPDRVVAVPGGKGLNAARAAAALGGSVVAIALLGGHAGAWIEERLAELTPERPVLGFEFQPLPEMRFSAADRDGGARCPAGE